MEKQPTEERDNHQDNTEPTEVPATNIPRQKRLKSVNWKDINNGTISFHNDQEIDEFLEKVGRQLKDDLKDVDTLNIL